MANCPKCGTVKIKKGKRPIAACRRCGTLHKNGSPERLDPTTMGRQA